MADPPTSTPGKSELDINHFHPSVIFHHMCIQRIIKTFDPEEESIRSFINHVSETNFLFLNVAHTLLDEMLAQYETKLRNEIHYQTISDQIVQHLQKFNIDLLGKEFTKTMKHAFLAPRGILQQDDQLMMALLVNCDLVVDSLNKKLFNRAEMYFEFGRTFLVVNSSADAPIDGWIFRFWIENAEVILDTNRVPCMISSMKLVGAQNIPDAPTTAYSGKAADPSTWKTVFAVNADHKPTARVKWRSLDVIETTGLITWFIVQRLPDETYAGVRKSLTKKIPKDYTGQDVAFLFLAVANNIQNSDVYKKLLNVLATKEKETKRSEIIKFTVEHIIQPSCTYAVTYEHIVMVSLLLSDVMNLCALEQRIVDVNTLYVRFMNEIFLQQPLFDLMTKGWKQMPSFLVELVWKPKLHIMQDYTLIGELKQYSQLSNKQNVPAVRVTEDGSIIDVPLPTPLKKFLDKPKPIKIVIPPRKTLAEPRVLCLYTEVNKSLYAQTAKNNPAVQAIERYSTSNYSQLTEDEYLYLMDDDSLPQGCSILDLEYTITDQELRGEIQGGGQVTDQTVQEHIDIQEAVAGLDTPAGGDAFDLLAMSITETFGQEELQKFANGDTDQTGPGELMEQGEDNDLADEMIADEEKDEALRDAQMF